MLLITDKRTGAQLLTPAPPSVIRTGNYMRSLILKINALMGTTKWSSRFA